jgi:hypothetical protein
MVSWSIKAVLKLSKENNKPSETLVLPSALACCIENSSLLLACIGGGVSSKLVPAL